MIEENSVLGGVRIAVPESRELDLFAEMLQRRGAEVLRCPLVSIHDSPDQPAVQAWLQAFCDNPPDDLVLLTGEGLRRLLTAAERSGLRERFIEALAIPRRITRGPKPGAALRQAGLKPDLLAEQPTSEGVIATLKGLPLQGRRVAVQLYGSEPNLPLVGYLQGVAAEVSTVAPYVYADDAEDTRVEALVRALLAGELDAIAFTSATQVRRLLQIARRLQCEAELLQALQGLCVAAVGPVVADELQQRGIQVDLMPQDSYFMKPLVRELVRELGRELPA